MKTKMKFELVLRNCFNYFRRSLLINVQRGKASCPGILEKDP